MWSSTFCIREYLSPFPACLPAALIPAWEACGASREASDGVLGRGFMASSGQDWIGAETWDCSKQRAWGQHGVDLQPSCVRAAVEWHTVELWDGSECPGSSGCSRSSRMPWTGVSRSVKVHRRLLSTQNTRASSVSWRRAGISALRSIWGCPFVLHQSRLCFRSVPPLLTDPACLPCGI